MSNDNVTKLPRAKTAGPEEIPGFGCGAVVVLKSGGPAMVVRCAIKSSDGPIVKVDWADEIGNISSAEFYTAQLQRFVPLDPDEVIEFTPEGHA